MQLTIPAGCTLDEFGYVVPDMDAIMRDIEHSERCALVDSLKATVHASIDSQLSRGELPILVAGQADGKTISTESMMVARVALLRLPRPILRSLVMAGCKITVDPVQVFRADSMYATCPEAVGVANAGTKTARIAGEAPNLTSIIMHEVGHLVDSLHVRFAVSRSQGWIAIWEAEKAAGRVEFFADQRLWPHEFFAESFSRFYCGERWKLSPAVQGFIENLKV